MGMVDLTAEPRLPAPIPCQSTDAVSVVLVTPDEDCHRRLASIFQHSSWKLKRTLDCDEALRLARRGEAPVVLLDDATPSGGWRKLLRKLGSIAPQPRLVVASRLADDPLWQDVLAEGGYNVLRLPFDQREVFWVLSHAWLDWRSERARVSRAATAAAS